MQSASESVVVLAFVSDGLLVRPQLVREIAEGGMGQGAVLAFLVPVVRPKCEKNANADEDDFQDNVEQGLLVFPAAQAHRALSSAIHGQLFKQGAPTTDEGSCSAH
jgi:hypothetical protein